MNTKLHASFFLPLLAASLSAQDLQFDAWVAPASIRAEVGDAAPDSLVVLVLGLRESPYKLPGGQMLGVEADLVTGFLLADSEGTASFDLQLPRSARDVDCFVQAVAVHPRLPLDAPGGITVSKVAPLRSPDD
jgi:hypothetical protein